MIPVDISLAIGIFFFVLIAAVFLLWVLSRKTPGKEPGFPSKHIRHCPICAHTYSAFTQEIISRCPQCGSYSKDPFQNNH